MNPTMSTPPFTHGELRGSDDPRRSRTFEGRFGRMFRSLDPAEFTPDAAPTDPVPSMASRVNEQPARTSEDVLKALAAKMTQQPRDIATLDPDAAAVPAGYTYLGQFIGHDITFDPASSLQRD